jgi:WhiB family redox-sensing transcriptional regulator
VPSLGVAYLGHTGPVPFSAEWTDEAACRSQDPAAFFSDAATQVSLAKQTCARCPVVMQCRQTADMVEGRLSGKHVHGVWGGETPSERIQRRWQVTTTRSYEG